MGRIPDPIDAANAEAERFLEEALKNRAPTPKYTGLCFNCHEKTDNMHFCDIDCRDDYELRQRR